MPSTILRFEVAGIGLASLVLAVLPAQNSPVSAIRERPCYDVTVDVPPYHPGATLCPPLAAA